MGDFIFRGTAHILLPCGDRLQEGKKGKKGKKGEKEVGFSFSARWFLLEKGTGSTYEEDRRGREKSEGRRGKQGRTSLVLGILERIFVSLHLPKISFSL